MGLPARHQIVIKYHQGELYIDSNYSPRTTLTSKLPGSNVAVRRERIGNIEPKSQAVADDPTGEYRNHPTMQGAMHSQKLRVLEPQGIQHHPVI